MEKRYAIPVRLGKEMVEFSLIKDANSFTGYSIISLSDGVTPGMPASIFFVALYRAYIRLLRENMKLKKIVEGYETKEVP